MSIEIYKIIHKLKLIISAIIQSEEIDMRKNNIINLIILGYNNKNNFWHKEVSLKIKNRSAYKYNVNVSKEDKILTLSTCTNIGEGRTVVHAKLIYSK